MIEPRQVSPKLLVSVRDAVEAAAALSGGADWIDLKEPSTGSLGAVSAEAAQQVGEFVAGRRPISAALGELMEWKNSAARRLLEVPGIDSVKLGLAGCADLSCWTEDWSAVQSQAARAKKSLVAVVYADWRRAQSPSPEQIVALAGETSCRYLLIDTFDKRSSGTISCLGATALESLVRLASESSLSTVLAGGITPSDLDRIPAGLIEMVAVRTAVCRPDRCGQVDQGLVARFRQRLVSFQTIETC